MKLTMSGRFILTTPNRSNLTSTNRTKLTRVNRSKLTSQSDTFVLYNSGLNGKVISLKQPDIAEFPEKKELYIEQGSDTF
jgi:hypothetical protein